MLAQVYSKAYYDYMKGEWWGFPLAMLAGWVVLRGIEWALMRTRKKPGPLTMDDLVESPKNRPVEVTKLG